MKSTTTAGRAADLRIGRVATLVSGVAVALAVGGVASFLVRGDTFQAAFDAWIFHNAPIALVGAPVGAMALRRQPHNLAARFLLASSAISGVHVALAGTALGLAARHPQVWEQIQTGAIRVVDVPDRLAWSVWGLSTLWIIGATFGSVFLFLYFPDGRLPSQRWRPAMWAGVVGVTLATAGYAWGTRPFSPHLMAFNTVPSNDTVATVLQLSGMAVLGVAGLGAVASLVVRYRTETPEQRARIRPAVVAGGLFVLSMVVLWPWQWIWAPVTAVTISLMLLTIGVTITRHRIFDVEVVISRTVVATVLGAFISLVYVGIVAGIGDLLGRRTDLTLSLAATALVAVTFEPLRRRVRTWSKRLVYGTETTPADVMEELSERLAQAESPHDVLDRVTTLLVEGTGAVRAEIHVPGARSWELAAASGDVTADAAALVAAVAHEGETLGEVRILSRRPNRFAPSDDRLLRQVAATLGPVLRNAALTGELEQRIEELRASRLRIVTAAEEARRDLERDIHDGAQQQLLALRIKLGLAATVAEREGAAETGRLLRAVGEDTDEAIRALRRIARGVYPPILEEQGLVAALRSHAREVPTLDIDVTTDDLGRYDRSVEAAVYFCCLEAIQNASKHASASRVLVDLRNGDGAVRFTVQDDGCGFDAQGQRDGSGIRNMSDRIEGLGGALTIESRRGSGTVVWGHVPATTAGPTEAGQPPVSDR